LKGTSLGLLPPLGERWGPPHNNRGLPNNSKIRDFFRAFLMHSLNSRKNVDHSLRYYAVQSNPEPGSINCFRTSEKARDYDVYSCYSTVAAKKTIKRR
jgi:hypothetical protein